MLIKRTDVIMVGFEETKARLTKAKKVVLTGTPTKGLERKLNLADKIALKEKYKLNPAKPTILACGGSQGAKSINDAILKLEEKKLNKSYQILLASGGKQYDIIKEELAKKGRDIENLDGLKIVPYIYELPEVIDSSEVIIARAGAMTITEIANAGKPSVLVPLPNVSHNHQMYNAQVLENIGAAKIIKDDDLDSDILNKEILEILKKGNLEKMGENARKVSIQNVADNIYDEIQNLIKGRFNGQEKN